MDQRKQFQEASFIVRFLSMEALLMLMGLASSLYGLFTGSISHILWGLVMVPGVLLLIRARAGRRGKNNHGSEG